MLNYILTIILLATIITVIAVAAGTIIYIGGRYGRSSLTFQLSRVGILWGAAILLLILMGVLGALVTGWTAESLSDIVAWYKEHNFVMNALDWCYENRAIGLIILWCGTIAAYVFFFQRSTCTAFKGAVIGGLHLAIGAYICQDVPVWPFAKAVIAVIVFFCCAGEFDEPKAYSEKPHAVTPPPHDDNPSSPVSDESVPDHHHPTVVLGNMIGELAETLAHPQ